MRRMLAIALPLTALVLGLASDAEAKLCVRIDAPSAVRVGSTFTVRVTTLLPTWEGHRLVDLEPERASIRLRLTVLGPGGTYREVRLRPTKAPAVWSTRLRLSRRGFWLLTVSGWERAPRECAPPERIRAGSR